MSSNFLSLPARLSVLLAAAVMVLAPTKLPASSSGTDDETLRKKLEEVSAALNELNAQREKLLQEKEQLQIQLWGSVPQEEKETEEYTEPQDLFEMSIVDLMNLDVLPVGTLTKSARRISPAAITTITQEQIWQSGAHSLNELLEIYIPGLQYSIQEWEFPHLGIRGITGDRDDKYLLLVNGRVLNERGHYGALSERDLPLLADIHHIDVIRGPGSAIYGPGAISGVINIVTENGLTFRGTEVTAKAGAIENFGSIEIKHGRKFSKDSGAYFYFGLDKYEGASQDWAPYVSGKWFTSWGDGYTVRPGRPVPFSVVNDNQAWAQSPRLKFHTQYTNGNFDFWARLSRGGLDYINPLEAYNNPAAAGWTWGPEWWQPAGQQAPSGTGYQQFTVFAKYLHELSDTFNIEYILSYDTFRYMRRDFSNNYNRHDEDEIFAKALARWTPNERHSVALGAELSLESFNSMSGGNFNAWRISTYDWDQEAWSTATYSGLGEWQWTLTDTVTLFLGGRVDKNSYTDTLYSPRAAVVYSLTPQDTLKFITAQSVRMQNAEESRLRWLETKDTSDAEELDNLEIRWERQHNDNLWFAFSGFTSKLDVIAWDVASVSTTNVGLQKSWGLEGEFTYKKDSWNLSASHSYVTLTDFDLREGMSTYLVSGDRLTSWSDHITKVQAGYQFNPNWSLLTSARIYWGFPGAEDYAEAHDTIDDGFSDAYDAAVFLNMGLRYQKEKISMGLDGTNLLGFIDKKYNRRLRVQGNCNDYRSTAPSVLFSLKYHF
ncbi:MAG TPA: TonB-dependent receptor plug domain-containing protein [Anaerohalosphaeraceae bacterium]|nr:TonB-dependent receptor plug domain-containing protein [Anaerohalosphaeraceae bacterium]